jgi:hypothetical protein
MKTYITFSSKSPIKASENVQKIAHLQNIKTIGVEVRECDSYKEVIALI